MPDIKKHESHSHDRVEEILKNNKHLEVGFQTSHYSTLYVMLYK